MVKQKKDRRQRRQFRAEFQAEALQLVEVGGEPNGQVARELDLTESALRARRKRKLRRSADSKHDLPIAPVVLQRDLEADAPNQLRVSGIKYVCTLEGWLCWRPYWTCSRVEWCWAMSQYASHDYRRLLDAHGIVCSMSRKGDGWDNAVVESFFASLRAELRLHRGLP